MQRQISCYLQCEEEKWDEMKIDEESSLDFTSLALDLVNRWIEEKRLCGVQGGFEILIF
jgi:hypothetical protein